MRDSVHYNQVSSIEMKAFFKNGEIRETQAINNVLVVYYPIDDADSTIIGLNYTETPLMKMFLENRKMKNQMVRQILLQSFLLQPYLFRELPLQLTHFLSALQLQITVYSWRLPPR